MSKIEVDQIVPKTGTNLTVGESGDTVTVPAGATFDASSGTFTLPDNAVTTAKISDNAVTTAKISDNVVTNAKLQNSSITINGSAVNLGGSVTIATGIEWQSTIVTGTTVTVEANKGYWIDTSSNACTATLPGSANVGDEIWFVDYARNFGSNALTINPNSLNYQGNSSPNPVYDTNGQAIHIVYSGATKGWIPTSDDDVSFETPQSLTVDFLCIAGGGGVNGTSNNWAGGGGAGGYRNSYASESSGGGGSSETSLTFTKDETYTITVGAGGAQENSGSTGNAQSGGDSSIAGTGITTVTSAGGGSSATSSSSQGTANNGNAGGSGGGATGGGTGGAGTSNQGFAGGNSSGYQNGGGGGGASAVGSNGSSTTGGAGGNGLSSSITGSAVTRGGGGGASGQS
jgi:uncharacterized membrane protein YgcG